MMRRLPSWLQKTLAWSAIYGLTGCGLFVELPRLEEGTGGTGSGGRHATGADGAVDAGGGRADAGNGGTGGAMVDASYDGGTGGSAAGGSGAGGAGTGGGFDGGADVGAGTGGSPILEASDCEDQCDCDKDGYASEACSGTDCDDLDPRVHPDQPDDWYDEPSPNVGFDYDCSGGVERRYTATINCVVAVLACNTTKQGYAAPPACGQSATWGTCRVVDALSCQVAPIEERKQTCH